MADYPQSLIAFQRRFPDDRACAEYLILVGVSRGGILRQQIVGSTLAEGVGLLSV